MLIGDAIEKVTIATGIKTVVDKISKKTGKDCGCAARKEKLNKIKILWVILNYKEWELRL